ncbi:MAG: RluA family pseudouridine synthase [Deltaproteobacteria bacterium]|nr:RluA family pseudouridine synthase [Deltaproteobacteria bacterium]
MTTMVAEDLEVTAALAGTRLEALVRGRFAGSSLTQVRRVIAAGDVLVNGRPQAKGYRLHEGDRVAIGRTPERADWHPAPGEVPGLLFVYEDAEVVAVAKPAGAPSAPLRAEETGTVANALVAHDAALAGIGRGPRDAGLVSRLDTGTSGLLLAARTKAAFAALLEASSRNEIAKGYLALVEGVRRTPWPSTIRRPLVPHGPRGATVVAGAEHDGSRIPETRILRTRSGTGATIVVAEIRQGMRHQVRAHLAAIGHPVLGDVERGGRPLGDGRLALHAAWIEFPHPRTGHRMKLDTPPMEPLASALLEVRLAVRKREEP